MTWLVIWIEPQKKVEVSRIKISNKQAEYYCTYKVKADRGCKSSKNIFLVPLIEYFVDTYTAWTTKLLN